MRRENKRLKDGLKRKDAIVGSRVFEAGHEITHVRSRRPHQRQASDSFQGGPCSSKRAVFIQKVFLKRDLSGERLKLNRSSMQ